MTSRGLQAHPGAAALLLGLLLPLSASGQSPYAPSHLDEVLLTADPLRDGSSYSFYWSGWNIAGSYGTTADGSEITYGKQPAYDAMCLAGVRFKEGNANYAEYWLTDDWAGWSSLEQIVWTCSYSRIPACDMVGKLYNSSGLDDPPAAEYLRVYDNGAIFDFGERVGTFNGLTDADVTGPGTIEGIPALDLLFMANASDANYSNRYLGWFRDVGSMDGTMPGKTAKYAMTPLYTIMLSDEHGRYAEYIINEGYRGLCLLEIVQKCMPDAWALRRNDGSQRWVDGHCEIGTLVAAMGLPEISDQLRLGVGDSVETAYKIQYRDWALFMPLKGNGNANFANNVWAFGSKGATNSGARGMVSIYGGPTTDCGTSLPEKVMCYYDGDRVRPGSEEMGACGTVQGDAPCDYTWDSVNVVWDDGYTDKWWADQVYELRPCEALPASEDMDMIFETLLFAADGMDAMYKNTYRGWFEQGYSTFRRLDEENDDTDMEYPGIRQAYWDVCLRSVKFSDDSGAYAMFDFDEGYEGVALGPLVTECLPGPMMRRNEDTMEWREGHCSVATRAGNYSVMNVSEKLRLGVGDGMESSDPNYPDFLDWALFMPVTGNAEHSFWEPHGGGNFANGVWAFGSKGVTNSLHDGPVYISGSAYAVELFKASSTSTDYTSMWPGWTEEGYLGMAGEGKTEDYDQLGLSSIYLFDMEGNYASYTLYWPWRGRTLQDIVSTCADQGGCQEVGVLERYGGPKLVSMRLGLDIASNETMVMFAPSYAEPGMMAWSIGAPMSTNPAHMMATDVFIYGVPYECKEPMTSGDMGGDWNDWNDWSVTDPWSSWSGDWSDWSVDEVSSWSEWSPV